MDLLSGFCAVFAHAWSRMTYRLHHRQTKKATLILLGMNAASLAAATSNGTAAAIRRSRVHGLDGFVTRSLLRTVSCGRTSLNQRESGTGISKEGSSATSTTTTTTRAAAAAPGERLYRPLSLVSQPSRAFATHARRAASAALVAIPLTRAAGRDTTGGSRSSFGGNVASDGREAAAAAAAAATAAIAFAAAQSVEEGNGRIGVGAGAGNSLAWCREEEGMWSSQREDRLPFSGATAGGATAAAAVEDDFTSAASATAAGATRRGDIDTPERLSAGYPLQQTQQHHHHDQHQRAAAAVGSEEAAAMLNGGSSTTSDCRGQLDDLARLEHMGGGNLKQKAVAATLRITDVYRFDSGDQPVGRGNRSIVTTATHRLTGLPVAVKRISRADTSRLEVRTYICTRDAYRKRVFHKMLSLPLRSYLSLFRGAFHPTCRRCVAAKSDMVRTFFLQLRCCRFTAGVRCCRRRVHGLRRL